MFKLLGILTNPKFWFAAILLDITTLSDFIHKYIFGDMTFLKWLVLTMIVDLVTGVTKVWHTQGWKAITSKGLRDSVAKVIQYGAFLVITHILTHYQISGQVNTNFVWINKLAYEFLILIEIKSVYENIIAINPSLDLFTKLFFKIAEVLKPLDNKGSDKENKQ